MLERAALAALLFGLVVLVAISATLPAFPVDETRYLTVAWEMRANGSWALPTLNFEPYSHKPPLLFWLINGFWSVLGLQVWPARLVGVVSMAAVLFLTHRLDRDLVPDPIASEGSGLPAASVLLLLGLPVFVGLGFAIMFDMLLTATVMGGLLGLWHAGRTGGRLHWLLYGFCIGLGLLAKGPVVLLYLLPPAFLSPFWIDPPQRKGWYLRLLGAIGVGAAMALAWAIRAAVLGGPEYAEMLFWKQSAGRVTSSFAHARPFWFYVPIAMMFFLPVLLWRPVRVALRGSLSANNHARDFLLSGLLPAFLGLSLISGKQLHYFLPLVPSVAILISLGLRKVEFQPGDRRAFLIVASAVGLLVPAAVLAARRWVPLDGTLSSVISDLNLAWVIAATAAAIAVLVLLNRSIPQILTGVAIANLIFLASIAAQSHNTVVRLYDLEPMSEVIAGMNSRPLATTQKSRGEFGFLAKLRRPLVHVSEGELACWLAKNPDGAAIVRSQLDDEDFAGEGETFRTLYRQTYRNDEALRIVEGQAPPKGSCENLQSNHDAGPKEIAPD